MADADLVLLAEQYRSELPDGFDALAQEVAVLLETGVPIETLTRGSGRSINHQIRQATIAELRLFLCTDDKRYADVRAHGRTFTKTSLASVSAYVAGAVGVSAGAAMACVAFIALAIAKVGLGVFCRLTANGKR